MYSHKTGHLPSALVTCLCERFPVDEAASAPPSVARARVDKGYAREAG